MATLKKQKGATTRPLLSSQMAEGVNTCNYQSFNDQLYDVESTIKLEDSGTSTIGAIFIVMNAAMGAGLLNFPRAFSQAGGIGPGIALEMAFLIFIAISLFSLAHCSHVCLLQFYLSRNDRIHCRQGIWNCQRNLHHCVHVWNKRCNDDHCGRPTGQSDGSHFWNLVLSPLVHEPDVHHVGVVYAVGIPSLLPKGYRLPETCQYYRRHRSFGCHGNCRFEILNNTSLKKKTMANWSIVIICTLVLCASSYTAAGIFGYLTFGDATKSDILESYEAKDWLVIAARISIAIGMITTYPILHFCGRSALITLLSKTGMFNETVSVNRERTRRYSITAIWFFPSLALALLIPNIGQAIAVVGGIAGCFILIFPGISLAKLMLDGITEKTLTIYFLICTGLTLFIGGVFLFGEMTCQAIIIDLTNTDPELSSKCYET